MRSGAQRRLRLVLIWGDTVVCERVLAPGRRATVGEDPGNTLVLPDVAGIGRKHALFTPTTAGYVLALTPAMRGWLRRAGHEHTLEPEAPAPRVIDLDTEGVLEIGAFQVLFHFVDAGATLPPPTLWQRVQDADTHAIGALALAFLLQVGLLIGAYALWDDAPRLTDLPERSRPIVCDFPGSLPPPPPPDEVAERPENEPGKRAGGDDGRFGKPEEKRPSKIPKHEGALVDKVAAQTLTRALTTNLLGGPLQSVLGGQAAFTNRLNAAMAGDGDVLVMGSGTGGVGMRGLGTGGGGESYGRIGGMGKLDVGGGGGPHVGLGRKTPKPRPPVTEVGRGDLNGFCREADIQKTVMARRNGPAYCYEKALAGDPELAGKVMLNWRIGTDGKVMKVIVESSTLSDPAVAQCVARQVERWVFPPTEGGICQVRYPFVFTAGQ